MKSCYNQFSELVSNSGFGWDHEKELPTAADDVWDQYIKAHPKASPYRHKRLQYYNDLKTIFAGKGATGQFGLSFTASNDELIEDYNNHNVAKDATLHVKSNRKSSFTAIGKRGFDLNLASTGNESKRSKSIATTVQNKMESICTVLQSTASKLLESTNPAEFAMKYFTEHFGSMYDEEQAYSFAMKLASNPAYPALFLGMSDTVKRKFIDEQIRKE